MFFEQEIRGAYTLLRVSLFLKYPFCKNWINSILRLAFQEEDVYLFLHSKYSQVHKIKVRQLFFKVLSPPSSVGETLTSYFIWERMFFLNLVHLQAGIASECQTVWLL